jgi:tetratricopeptide (TPR) repeat protein
MKKGVIPLVCAMSVAVSQLIAADPVRLYERGKDFQNHENWYGAIEAYQEALHENPSYGAVYANMAECFYAIGEYAQALDQVKKAETFRKNDPALMDLRGFIMIGLGKIDEASAIFTDVLKIWPNDVQARFGIAEIDVSAGRISSASSQYLDALKRNPENRKALLSLALVSEKAGNASAARGYMEKALQYHGENPQVFYFAAYLAFSAGQYAEAEARVRNALAMKSDYDDAQELLASVLYRTGRYGEVIDICNARVLANRNRASAWYLKTLALEKLARYEEALKSARAGLEVAPDDDILRSLAENVIINRFPMEDARRAQWAEWHVLRAAKFSENNMSDQALYEYRRALKVNPYDVTSRQVYAKIFLNKGYPERYLEQLLFVQSLGKSTNQVNDAVESYKKILSTSVPAKWNIDPLYLDKAHASIGLYFQADPTNVMHPDSERITTGMLGEVFSYDLRFKVVSHDAAAGSFSQAFRESRESGEDYFALVSFNENARDTRITVDLYVSRTGSKAESWSVFRTGNDRYANALRRLVQIMSAAFPAKGVVISRYQTDAVIDLGKMDGVKADQKFDIVPKDAVRVSNSGIGLQYEKADVLGVFTASTVDEDVTQGKLERSGFFDRINAGDIAVLNTETADAKKKAAETAPPKEQPELLSLLRKIR